MSSCFRAATRPGPAYAAAAAQLLEFDPDGKFIREIGHNLYAWSFAHTVRVDKEDNIWVTDKGSDMVIKFNPDGRVIMVFGRKQEASDEGTEPLKHPKPPLPPVDGMFRQVTDVAWDAAGNTFISDGYINSRVAKVDKDGNWLKSWGEPGNGPGQFNTPHSIAADAQGQRLRRRSRQPPHPGVRRRRQVSARRSRSTCRSPPDAQPAIGNKPGPTTTRHSWRRARPGRSASRRGRNQVLYASDAFPGRIYKLSLDGKVLGVLGESGKQLEAVRLDSRDGVPVGERALRRGTAELARAEADSEALIWRSRRHVQTASLERNEFRASAQPRSCGKAGSERKSNVPARPPRSCGESGCG